MLICLVSKCFLKSDGQTAKKFPENSFLAKIFNGPLCKLNQSKIKDFLPIKTFQWPFHFLSTTNFVHFCIGKLKHKEKRLFKQDLRILLRVQIYVLRETIKIQNRLV
jgi:hypothetical protein